MMAERSGGNPESLLGTVATFGLLGAFAVDSPGAAVALLALMQMLAMIVALARRRSFDAALASVAMTTSGVLYIGLLLGYFIALRMIDAGGERSAQLLSILFLIVWAGDTGAYVTGRLLGRKKLAPNVSPGKTVEGAAGGMLIGLLGGVIGRLWFFQDLPWIHVFSLSLLLGFAGILGDLCESMLKRGAQMKDSGGTIPGHGGFLDRLDSLVFSAPVLYYYYRFLLA